MEFKDALVKEAIKIDIHKENFLKVMYGEKSSLPFEPLTILFSFIFFVYHRMYGIAFVLFMIQLSLEACVYYIVDHTTLFSKSSSIMDFVEIIIVYLPWIITGIIGGFIYKKARVTQLVNYFEKINTSKNEIEKTELARRINKGNIPLAVIFIALIKGLNFLFT